MDPEEADRRLLTEMLREAERVIDHQVRAIEHLDRKAERLLVISATTFAGGVALASLVAEQAKSISSAHVALASGTLLNLAAVLLLVEAYLGLRRHPVILVGPSLVWVRDKALTDDWRIADHVGSLLTNLARHEAANARLMRETSQRSRLGFLALSLAVLSYAASYILMVQGGS